MQVELIEDAPVLIPNKEHKNFTHSNTILAKGTTLDGNKIEVKGKRKGEDFTYRLFATDNKQLIYLNKTKPTMKATEVTLGADGATPTVVTMPKAGELFTTHTVIGMLIGAGAAYMYAKKSKSDKTKTMLYVGGGAVAGFFAGRFIERKKILVKNSK